MPLQPGAAFARFRIVSLLGTGGMGAVYKAYEEDLRRHVALKVLPAHGSPEPGFAKLFQTEARVVAHLEHPNIVPLYHFGIDDDMPWMAMRLLNGGTLADRIDARRREGRGFHPAEVAALLGGVAAALDHAHRRGVVHRDVKPTNIMFDDENRVYLGDFGVAAILADATMRTTGVPVSSSGGTPSYMSPEQATGRDVDGRSDVYALGIVAYEMLTGSVPFKANSALSVLMKHVNDPVPIPPADRVPPPVFEPVRQCLAKEPALRYATATAFIAALAAAPDAIHTVRIDPVAGAPAASANAASAVAQPEAAAPGKKRRTWTFAISVTITFAVLVLAVVPVVRPAYERWIAGVRKGITGAGCCGDGTPIAGGGGSAAVRPPMAEPPNAGGNGNPRLEAARQLARDAQRLFADGKLTAAKAKFLAAKAQYADTREANAGLADIRKREQDYTSAKTRAERLAAADPAAARDAYLQAARAHVEWSRRDAIADKLAAIDARDTAMGRSTSAGRDVAVAAAPVTAAPSPSRPTPAPPSAPGRWHVPYDKAIVAIQKQEWDAAVELLRQAIAIDPVPLANKRMEATLTQDYFPQFYLFYAHVKLKQYERARPYASAPRPAKPVVVDAAAVIAEFNSFVQRKQ